MKKIKLFSILIFLFLVTLIISGVSSATNTTNVDENGASDLNPTDNTLNDNTEITDKNIKTKVHTVYNDKSVVPDNTHQKNYTKNHTLIEVTDNITVKDYPNNQNLAMPFYMDDGSIAICIEPEEHLPTAEATYKHGTNNTIYNVRNGENVTDYIKIYIYNHIKNPEETFNRDDPDNTEESSLKWGVWYFILYDYTQDKYPEVMKTFMQSAREETLTFYNTRGPVPDEGILDDNITHYKITFLDNTNTETHYQNLIAIKTWLQDDLNMAWAWKLVNASTNRTVNETYTVNVTENVTQWVEENYTENITEEIPYQVVENITVNTTKTVPYNVTEVYTENITVLIPQTIIENITVNITEKVPYNITELYTENVTVYVPTEKLIDYIVNTTKEVAYNTTEEYTENVTVSVPKNKTEYYIINVTQEVPYNITEEYKENITEYIPYNKTEPTEINKTGTQEENINQVSLYENRYYKVNLVKVINRNISPKEGIGINQNVPLSNYKNSIPHLNDNKQIPDNNKINSYNNFTQEVKEQDTIKYIPVQKEVTKTRIVTKYHNITVPEEKERVITVYEETTQEVTKTRTKTEYINITVPEVRQKLVTTYEPVIKEVTKTRTVEEYKDVITPVTRQINKTIDVPILEEVNKTRTVTKYKNITVPEVQQRNITKIRTVTREVTKTRLIPKTIQVSHEELRTRQVNVLSEKYKLYIYLLYLEGNITYEDLIAIIGVDNLEFNEDGTIELVYENIEEIPDDITVKGVDDEKDIPVTEDNVDLSNPDNLEDPVIDAGIVNSEL